MLKFRYGKPHKELSNASAKAMYLKKLPYVSQTLLLHCRFRPLHLFDKHGQIFGGNLALCWKLSHLHVAELVKQQLSRDTRANLQRRTIFHTHCTKHVDFELPSIVLERLINHDLTHLRTCCLITKFNIKLLIFQVSFPCSFDECVVVIRPLASAGV